MWNTFSKQKGIVYAKLHTVDIFRRLPFSFFLYIFTEFQCIDNCMKASCWMITNFILYKTKELSLYL